MRTALLGGSFDPPHLAHLQIAEYLLNSGRFDRVWVFPSPQNPLKGSTADFKDRLAMCRLAFADFGPRVEVREDEASLSGYTIDLVRHLLAENPKLELTFVGGSDLRAQLNQWKDPAELQRLVKFEFFPRPPDPSSPFPPISSTEVRDRIKKGLPIDRLVPKAVEAYIRDKRLYAKA